MAITNRALAFASRWFDEATVRGTFEPLIADWQREWQDSPPPHRAWVSVRGLVAFVCAVAFSSPNIIRTPIPRSIAGRVATRIAMFCSIVAGLLSIPMVRSISAQSMELLSLPTVLLLALPGALMIAFPFSMVIAVDAIRHEDGVARQVERAAALKVAVLAVVFMVMVGGFVVPFASQEWLRISTPVGWNTPPPKLNQLSTLALLRHPDRETAIVPGQYTRAGVIRATLMNRASASLMPALLMWLRWTMLNQRRRRRYWLGSIPATALIAAAFFTASYSGYVLENELRWRPGSGLWVPVVALSAWSILQQVYSTRLGSQEAPEAP